MTSVYRKLEAELTGLLVDFGILKADKYDKLSDTLKDILFDEWNAHQKEAVNDLIRRINAGDGKLTADELDASLLELGETLGRSVGEAVRSEAKKVITHSYGTGQEQILGILPSYNVVDLDAIKWLGKDTVYWIGSYYDKHVRTNIQTSATEAIREGVGREEAGAIFKKKFKEELGRSNRYFEGLANHVITRSREFGNVEGYVKAGIKKLRVKAIMDNRTSDICKQMNGRIITVNKAVKLRDGLMSAKKPEDVKDIAPWMKPSEIKGKRTSQLPVGMSLPPYHFSCRTRTVAVFDDDPVADKMEMGENVKKADKKALNSYTPEEYGNIIGDIGRKKHYGWRDKDLRDDLRKVELNKHIGEFPGEMSGKDYREYPGEIIKTAKYINARVYKEEIQLTFYSTAKKGFVVTDLSGTIRGLYGHKKRNATQNAFENIKERELWLKQNGNH